LGGAVGSMLRYAVQNFFGTICCCISNRNFACKHCRLLLIGILWSMVSRSLTWNDEMKLLLMTGCGGFTTFSAFTLEELVY
jgi:fluoride ion exporter CrcB/FEX